jgi:hypothetical protein
VTKKAKAPKKRLPVTFEGRSEQPKAKARRKLDDRAFEDFCAHIGDGKSLRSWAKKTGYAPSALVKWILRDPLRQKLYREARRMQADSHVDDLIELADEAVPVDDQGRTDSGLVNDKRLRIETRKWVSSKFHPGMYGDRVDADITLRGADQKPDAVLAQIVALLASQGLRITTEATDGPDQPA